MSEDSTAIVIPRKTRLPEAEALVKILLDLPSDQPLVFDCSQVEEIGAPYIIAMIAALHSREGLTPPAVAINPPTQFVDAFSDLGLFQDLMKMEFQT